MEPHPHNGVHDRCLRHAGCQCGLMLAQVLTLFGAAVYLICVLVVTGMGNVPMNKRLDAMAGHLRETAEYWPRYAQRWKQLNHVRTVGSILAAVCWLAAAMMV